MVRRNRAIALAAVLLGSVAVSACMTATPYQAATGKGDARTGYWDEQIEANRFRVTFAGNSLTSRETVERYLLYRSAQLTLEQGADYFTMAARDTERHSSTWVDQPFGPGPWGYWGPSWRFRGPGWGWRSGDPYWGGPFWGGYDVQQVNRYEATAEIVLGKGPKPADVHAFDARDVIQRLGPQVGATPPVAK
jgi:hypothetical protein